MRSPTSSRARSNGRKRRSAGFARLRAARFGAPARAMNIARFTWSHVQKHLLRNRGAKRNPLDRADLLVSSHRAKKFRPHGVVGPDSLMKFPFSSNDPASFESACCESTTCVAKISIHRGSRDFCERIRLHAKALFPARRRVAPTAQDCVLVTGSDGGRKRVDTDCDCDCDTDCDPDTDVDADKPRQPSPHRQGRELT
jgi:hypothetical protein